MIRKLFISSFFAAAAACCAMAGSLTASATTVEDVMAEARKWGYPESTIQDGYNYYLQDPELYTSDDFDAAISQLRRAGSNLITTGPQKGNDKFTTTTTTTALTTTVSEPSSQQSGTTSSAGSSGAVVTTTVSGSSSAPDNQQSPEQSVITLTMPDGSTFTRMSKEDFIKLSYEDKMAYLCTFGPAQQQVFIDNLSPEEYRSLLKQLPTDQKLEVVQELSGAVEAMGMNLTVEELTDDSLSIAMRTDEGELIGVTNAGTLVEDTGYDRSGILAAAGAIFFAASASAFLLIRRSFSNKNTGGNNE